MEGPVGQPLRFKEWPPNTVVFEPSADLGNHPWWFRPDRQGKVDFADQAAVDAYVAARTAPVGMSYGLNGLFVGWPRGCEALALAGQWQYLSWPLPPINS